MRADIPQRPDDYTPVNDFADVIDDDIEREISDSLWNFWKATTCQMAIVTVTTLDGYEPADYAHTLFEEWGIGSAETNSGVLMLVKPKYSSDDRGEAFICTGYGMEGVLPDITCHKITESMVPYFKNNDYSGGINYGAQMVRGYVRGEFGDEAFSSGSTEMEEWDLGPFFEVPYAKLEAMADESDMMAVVFVVYCLCVYMPMGMIYYCLECLLVLIALAWIVCTIMLFFRCEGKSFGWRFVKSLKLFIYVPVEIIYVACLAWAAIWGNKFTFLGRPCSREIAIGDLKNLKKKKKKSKRSAALSSSSSDDSVKGKKRGKVKPLAASASEEEPAEEKSSGCLWKCFVAPFKVLATILFFYYLIPLAAFCRIKNHGDIVHTDIDNEEDLYDALAADKGHLFGQLCALILTLPFVAVMLIVACTFSGAALGGSGSGGGSRGSWGGGHSGGGGGGSSW